MEHAAHTLDRGRLLDEALSLPEADRAYLAQSLQDSLPESCNGVAQPRTDVRRAWREEIRRWLKEIDEGRAVLVDRDEVMLRLKDRYRHEARVP